MTIVAGNDIVASDFIDVSAGAADAGKAVKADAQGFVGSTFLRRGGTGVDGALSITSGTTTLSFASANVLEKNYTSITISGTGALAFSNPAANGSIAVLKSQGDVVITSTATRAIDLRLMGAPGGLGYVAGSYICGDGGRGAGGLWIDCGGGLNFTGTIDATGANGTNASSPGAIAGGGGPGGGGSVLITANRIIANTGTINITGGTQGSSVSSGGCTGTNVGANGADAYANVGKLAGGTGANAAASTTTSPRFFVGTVLGNYLFIAPGAGGGGGGANGCSVIGGGGGMGASVTSKDGYGLVATYDKLK